MLKASLIKKTTPHVCQACGQVFQELHPILVDPERPPQDWCRRCITHYLGLTLDVAKEPIAKDRAQEAVLARQAPSLCECESLRHEAASDFLRRQRVKIFYKGLLAQSEHQETPPSKRHPVSLPHESPGNEGMAETAYLDGEVYENPPPRVMPEGPRWHTREEICYHALTSDHD